MRMATIRAAAPIPTPIFIPVLPPAASFVIDADGIGVIDTAGTVGLMEPDEEGDATADTAEDAVVVTDELELEVAFKENVRAFTSSWEVKVTPTGLSTPAWPE